MADVIRHHDSQDIENEPWRTESIGATDAASQTSQASTPELLNPPFGHEEASSMATTEEGIEHKVHKKLDGEKVEDGGDSAPNEAVTVSLPSLAGSEMGDLTPEHERDNLDEVQKDFTCCTAEVASPRVTNDDQGMASDTSELQAAVDDGKAQDDQCAPSEASDEYEWVLLRPNASPELSRGLASRWEGIRKSLQASYDWATPHLSSLGTSIRKSMPAVQRDVTWAVGTTIRTLSQWGTAFSDWMLGDTADIVLSHPTYVFFRDGQGKIEKRIGLRETRTPAGQQPPRLIFTTEDLTKSGERAQSSRLARRKKSRSTKGQSADTRGTDVTQESTTSESITSESD